MAVLLVDKNASQKTILFPYSAIDEQTLSIFIEHQLGDSNS